MTESNNTQQQTQFNILLIGDDCTDVYQYGVVDRISPEAPVPIFKLSYEERKPGMAHNVMKNLEALGCNVTYLATKATNIKTRLIDIRSKQQIVRIDNDVRSDPISFETVIPPGYDAIVISDYDKGSVTYELVEELRKEFKGPIFVDTKKIDLARFEGCIVKINQSEYEKAVSFSSDMIITQGAQGALYQGDLMLGVKVDVVDVCGAGDTFLSALVYKTLESGNLRDAISFANRASAVTVQHIGVYAPTLEEIK
jgi:D-beta-D-heptose 7-phosphate kinase/D-beta-D-heptose 1-phosphate adenosyltransferase